MTEKEKELLEGMTNCFRVCGANFDETVRMVAGRRGLTSEEVKKILFEMKEKYSQDKKYQEFREKLPSEFPL